MTQYIKYKTKYTQKSLTGIALVKFCMIDINHTFYTTVLRIWLDYPFLPYDTVAKKGKLDSMFLPDYWSHINENNEITFPMLKYSTKTAC